MNKLTKEQATELEVVIRKAVPESMKLDLGCYVEPKRCGDIRRLTGKPFLTSNSKLGQWIVPMEFIENPTLSEFERDFKILGRKLNLQDVLIACNENHKYLWVNQDMGHLYVGEPPMPTDVFYDLTKDYHNQSEEFYQFLHQLLFPSPTTMLTKQQKIELIATKIMGWERKGDSLWFNDNPPCDDRGRMYYRDFENKWNPLENWNHWRQVEEKMMEDGKSQLLKNYMKWFDGKFHYLGADLPEKVDALLQIINP